MNLLVVLRSASHLSLLSSSFTVCEMDIGYSIGFRVRLSQVKILALPLPYCVIWVSYITSTASVFPLETNSTHNKSSVGS